MGQLPFERKSRDILVRQQQAPSTLGQDPNKRSISELLVSSVISIDKPAGPTSHQTSAYVQKILGVKKSGHSGTLDPNVTGVLAVAVGKATRVVQAMQPAGKEYICQLHLHKELPHEEVTDAIMSFVGKIKQLPPIKSAVKREWRFRKIYYIEILEIDGQEALFRVGCQAGTYIRKLCHDIGEKLGCGGHMADLRRTKAGACNESKIWTLQDLTDAMHYYKTENNETFLRAMLEPIERGVEHLAKVYVLDSTVNTLCHGASLGAPGVSSVESDIQVGDMVALMTAKSELIGIGTARMISNDMISKKKGICVSTDAIFMQADAYPKMQEKKK